MIPTSQYPTTAPHLASSPPAPPSVRRAHRLWLLAVAAGLVETVLVVTHLLLGAAIGATALVVEVVVRFSIFAAAVVAARRMSAGSRPARWALAIVLGGVGLASLLVGPIGWLAAGHSVAEVRLSPLEWAFSSCRVVHVLAVVGATVSMFTPAANRWFAAHPARIGARSDEGAADRSDHRAA